MNKKEFIAAVANKAGHNLTTTKEILEAMQSVIEETVVVGGDEINITGFIKFHSRTSSARQGRNPATGETIQIPESTRAVSTLSKTFSKKA